LPLRWCAATAESTNGMQTCFPIMVGEGRQSTSWL
jgi:hypothetical protein